MAKKTGVQKHKRSEDSMAVRSAREAAYETIRSRIITMELKPGDELNDHELAQELGISRAAVWKRIAQLREDGWQIEAAGRRGYRLIPGDSLDPIFWVNQLTTKTLGRAINHYEHTITSSNTLVKQMAVQGAPSGSLCLCECQTAGKGRLGRTWSAPAGQAILMSVLLRPKLPPKNAPLITLATAMAMAHAVREVTGIDAQIKWPNDLVFSGKKLCGILLEISADLDQIEYVVVGTGLNVLRGAYPPELSDRAAALEEFANPPVRRGIVVHYLKALEDNMTLLEEHGFPGIQEAYRRHCCTLGSRVHVIGTEIDFIGTAEDIDETGALLVRDESGVLQRVLSGDVSVRGVMGYV